MSLEVPVSVNVDSVDESAAAPTQKYFPGDQIRHIARDRLYVIHVTPAEHIYLEDGDVPAYGYAIPGIPTGPENKLWFRSQTEVEDESRFQFVPPAVEPEPEPDTRPVPEGQQAGILEVSVRSQIDSKLKELLGDGLTAESDMEAEFERIGKGLADYAMEQFSADWNVDVGGLWALPHVSKAGIPVYFRHKTLGIDFEVSTNFEIPVDKAMFPTMDVVDTITNHLVEGEAHQIIIQAMRGSDDPATDSFNRYDLHGFKTINFGRRGVHNGLAIVFQSGDANGVTIEALLAVCKHRLEQFQKGDLPNDFNTSALRGIDEALASLKARTHSRIEAGTVSTKAE